MSGASFIALLFTFIFSLLHPQISVGEKLVTLWVILRCVQFMFIDCAFCINVIFFCLNAVSWMHLICI